MIKMCTIRLSIFWSRFACNFSNVWSLRLRGGSFCALVRHTCLFLPPIFSINRHTRAVHINDGPLLPLGVEPLHPWSIWNVMEVETQNYFGSSLLEIPRIPYHCLNHYQTSQIVGRSDIFQFYLHNGKFCNSVLHLKTAAVTMH